MAKKRDAFNEINITPLTDIFLVLLIIMMVVAPLLDEQGLNLTVPTNTEVQKDHKKPQILTINVSNEGRYTCDREEILPEKLADYIKAHAQKYKDGVLIQAQDDATHGAVVKVMDAARNAGVTNVSLSNF